MSELGAFVETAAGGRSMEACGVAVQRPRLRHALLPPHAFAHVFRPLAGLRVGFVRPNGNVGDALIELAMRQLMREFGVHWRFVDPDQPCPRSIDLLVFGGGGNMGTLYADSYAIRTKSLALGPPLVILPQSFATAEPRPFERVYVRERSSLALCPRGILAPDLALGLAWPSPPGPTHDLGVFLRRDRERQGWKPWFAADPVKLCREPAEYLTFAARYRRIVTDRLHFAIAGLHAGRDVVLVANSYHKNESMHATWLAGLGCRFAATPAAAAKFAA